MGKKNMYYYAHKLIKIPAKSHSFEIEVDPSRSDCGRGKRPIVFLGFRPGRSHEALNITEYAIAKLELLRINALERNQPADVVTLSFTPLGSVLFWQAIGEDG